MQRIRIFRVLLPAALILFILLVAISLNRRPAVHGAPGEVGQQAERFATNLDIVSIKGEHSALDAQADLVAPQADGGYHLVGIEHLGIARRGRGPLEVSAAVADVRGSAGERTMEIRDQVIVRDPEAGLVLSLPVLDVDETAGEARSNGEIRFESPGMQGRASGLVYGLSGQPSRLDEPRIEHADGGWIAAAQAVLFDGLRDFELRGGVSAERDPERWSSGRARIWRDDGGRLRRVEAQESVHGRFGLDDATMAEISCDRIDARWDEWGELERFHLTGDALLSRDRDSLGAMRLDGERQTDHWQVTAAGTVYLTAEHLSGPVWLRAEEVVATFDREMRLRGAEASDRVRFEGRATRAEADRAWYDPSAATGQIRLASSSPRKARLARERTRVAAARISTDLEGDRLVAEERVEATLLPGPGRESGAGSAGLFRTEEAIHFVARRLESSRAGSRLVFRGNVRGWQSERNLSAETIELEQSSGTLKAERDVTTRIPRDGAGSVLSEADYIQIAAEGLDYDEKRRLARYSGGVRLTLSEGALEAESLDVRLSAVGGRLEEVWAHGSVRIEFREADDGEVPKLVIGTADRLLYSPAEQTVRLFGDDRPASVRRLGAGGAVTSGRVLRYRLDVGTLEVEPGEGAPARIQGS